MESSALMEIRKTAAQYAEVISQVTGVDVDIMDSNYVRVAGTGDFAQRAGENMRRQATIYERVLKTGRLIVVEHPGKAPTCRACSRRESCTETMEIAAPIRFSGRTEGVIGLMAFTESQRDILLEKIKSYIRFVEQMADLVGKKLQENSELRVIRTYTDTLAKILDNIEQCVLILTDKNTIRSANSAACKNLGLPDGWEGRKAALSATGDSIEGLTEYRLVIQEKTYSILGELYPMYMDTEDAIQVLLFREKEQVRSGVYELTGSAMAGENPIAGTSPATNRLRENIRRVAGSVSTVLITGESGTGKELVANAIWKASDRRDQAFVALNCAAIPETLLESELFGYVKGAFTGANPGGRMGKFELANHGVLFLDEIGDMPLYLQAKLLRVLQERVITRIGSNNQIKVDIRIIAATNKDLQKAIRENKFREDLYYRLNVIPIRILPLRERVEDITDLTGILIRRYCTRFQKRFIRITPDAMAVLTRYAWPGNVRELENTVEFMINMMGADGVLDKETLPESLLGAEAEPRKGEIPTLDEMERELIRRALQRYGTDTRGKKLAAGHLGIAVSTLYKKLEKYGGVMAGINSENRNNSGSWKNGAEKVSGAPGKDNFVSRAGT